MLAFKVFPSAVHSGFTAKSTAKSVLALDSPMFVQDWFVWRWIWQGIGFLGSGLRRDIPSGGGFKNPLPSVGDEGPVGTDRGQQQTDNASVDGGQTKERTCVKEVSVP